MRKKKESSILLPADKYWSDKLDIDFEVELARYRFLCGSMLEEGKQSLNGHYYTTYKDWKSYIEEKISHLDHSELTEFFHYLQNEERMAHIRNKISSNFLIPFMISICLPYIFDFLTAITNNTGHSETLRVRIIIAIIQLSITIILVVWVYRNVPSVTRQYKVDEFKIYFYSDLKKIAAAHMKENG